MIVCKDFPNEVFATKEDLFKKLKENKSLLIANKKLQTKYTDSFDYNSVLIDKKINADKSESEDNTKPNTLKVVSVINTTNILDSHGDVHIKGIWNKTVKENKNMLLLNQHRATFENIITDEVQAEVKTYKWRDLGYNIDGETEALVFTSDIEKSRNPYMYEQYKNNVVKNHSVGMRYVKVELAVNSEDDYFKEEKEVFDKYIDTIVNKEEVEQNGFFWAVLEAKAMEGSAVVFGSNPITPTISTQENKEVAESITTEIKNEPTEVTQDELIKQFLTSIKF